MTRPGSATRRRRARRPRRRSKRLRGASPGDAAAWVEAGRPASAKSSIGTRRGQGGALMPISHHPDEVVAVTRGYGAGEKPEDFLDGFTSYRPEQRQQDRGADRRRAAPARAHPRPADARCGWSSTGSAISEANLRRAWQDAKNEDIAASIIGFVRQAALGDALIPFEERVRAAMKRILRQPTLDGPAAQMAEAHRRAGRARDRRRPRRLSTRSRFEADGGFQRLNKVFGGKLEAVLSDINEELWRKAA